LARPKSVAGETPSPLQAPQPRIVQFRKRRYSVRLEPIFWQTLETLAKRRGMRVGKFVGLLAEDFGGKNFASHLRVLCMLEGERALAQANLAASRNSLLSLLLSAYGPGLLLSGHRTVVAYNAGFQDWLGREFRPSPGDDLTEVLQVRTRRPLNELWLDLVAGKALSVEINVLHVRPGRVLAAPARLVAMPASADGDFYAVLWISTRRRGGIESPPRRPRSDHV
jgi:predicted DNA-binding ribbon-helix-helix protein